MSEFIIEVHATRTGRVYHVSNTRMTKHLRGGFHGVLTNGTRNARRYPTRAAAEQSVKALRRHTSPDTYTLSIVETLGACDTWACDNEATTVEGIHRFCKEHAR